MRRARWLALLPLLSAVIQGLSWRVFSDRMLATVPEYHQEPRRP